VQGGIALIVTPEGFSLAYEVLPGNTTDKITLRDFLKKIRNQYGIACTNTPRDSPRGPPSKNWQPSKCSTLTSPQPPPLLITPYRRQGGFFLCALEPATA